MNLTNDIEYQIDIIRDEIYEEIKNMPPSEETAYFNAIAQNAKEKYNIKVVNSTILVN